MADAYEKLTIPKLKALAEERGYSAALKSGLKKAQIIEKIREAEAEAEATPSGAEEQENATPDAEDAAIAIAEVSGSDHPDSEPLPPKHHDTIQPTEDTQATLLPESVDTVVAQDEPLSATSSITLPADQPNPPPTAPKSAEEPVVASAEINAHPTANEQSTTIQRDASANATTPLATDEILEDSRKRKRRSLSPPVNADEMAKKRQKQTEETDVDVSFTEAMPELVESDEKMAGEASATAATINERSTARIEKKSDTEGKSMAEDSEKTQARAEAETVTVSTEQIQEAASALLNEPAPVSKDVRSLFNKERSVSTKAATPATEVTEMPTTEPAIHPATRALYMRNFKRPLQEVTLRKHLVSLANAGDTNADTIENLYLDQLKTHALVLFPSITAATRVRAALHGRVWPQERDRNALWVDFIPDENVSAWINAEKNADSGNRTGGRRWEVVYSKTQDEGAIEAIHQEEGSKPFLQPPRRPSVQDSGLTIKGNAPQNAPLGPRGSISTPAARPPSRGTGTGANTAPLETRRSFQTLDELFVSTSSKPKLYYKPVAAGLVERRKEALRRATRRGWSEREQRGEEELFRYSFEGEQGGLVHSGVHKTSPRIMRREGGFRGGRGGGGYRRLR